MKELVGKIDSFAVRMPSEKLYLHIDKPYYTNTDTIWLKSYLLNGSLGGSEQSGLLYAELVNDTGRVVLRQSMPVLMGISWGQIALDSIQVTEGSYTLRAYTNWMQNQGEESFFTRQLYISKTDAGSWLVKAGSKTDIRNGKENTEVALQLLGQDGDPVRLQDLELKLRDGNKTRLREKMQTDIEGKLRFNFDVPAKAGRLKLVAEDKSGKRIVFPLNLNRDENADVQFMPEGGSLVAGLTSKIGFKAIGEDGRGINVSGVITDSKGNEVAAFKNGYKGMGYFVLTPAENESYMARVKLPKGQIKSYPLPPVKPSGMVLTVNNVPGRDSVILSVQATPVVLGSYSLIGQSGGKVYYASTVSFKPGTHMINGRIAKNKFPTGVARFTLFGNTNQAVAERIVFIDHHDRLQISIDTDKQHYQPNDSVSLAIKVTDQYNNPVQGSFSLAVTDDSQVKADSTNVPDISSYMLLQSELKGDIEEPGYFFTNPNAETALQLDNLMLTQGWVGYSWQDVFAPTNPPKYRAEKEIEVTGTITKISGTPLAGLQVSLLSTRKPLLFMQTVTSKDGRFKFSNLPRIDTGSFLVQLKDSKWRIMEPRINVDEFIPASTRGISAFSLTPWYINTDDIVLNFTQQSLASQKQLERLMIPAGTALAEVLIKGRKKIKGSRFFAGVGAEPDLVLDEKDMLTAGKKNLEDVMKDHIKGFNPKMFPCSKPVVYRYMVGCCPAMIRIDGMSLDSAYVPPSSFNSSDFFGFQQSYLQTITAEDVRGVEVRTAHAATYCYTIIEITTWSKKGVYIKRMHGQYLYRPLPLSWPKEFYKPKYGVNTNSLFDYSSTLHWQPDIVTDEAGKARVFFKAKSKKGFYSIILQGGDIKASTGCIRKKLSVFMQ
ncbi:hypothetical protein DJ568_16120 [Mucilaginibacter hurinus]|uniref:Carboxypeptidase regulatory-like domain-containing protein n=1 Tax=Mucilaginibacter hurinus TaxID=2201324 RepID=A0A367GM45_9SPHI|nr:carboxypeptidase-like regulatory domain-containing protein [Mucilaginibacter hurinus]RCH53763.1 hypothetical protein DJ568_16120 [Mucilaginibacter hurinus]